MSVVELEAAVEKLSIQELHEFTHWFDSYRQQQWDRQIETDLKAGKLDDLIAEARQSSRERKTRSLP